MKIEWGNGSFDWELFKEIQQNLLQKNQRNLENFRKEIKQRSEGNQEFVSNGEIQKIIEEIKRKLDYLNKYLKIEIDRDLKIPVVKIIERDTNRIIRQIPPDYLLELVKRIDEMLGILLNERV